MAETSPAGAPFRVNPAALPVGQGIEMGVHLPR